MANIRKLTAEHKLVIPAFHGRHTLRGIFVFQAESATQVQEWTNSDPRSKQPSICRGAWTVAHRPSDSQSSRAPGFERTRWF